MANRFTVEGIFRGKDKLSGILAAVETRASRLQSKFSGMGKSMNRSLTGAIGPMTGVGLSMATVTAGAVALGGGLLAAGAGLQAIADSSNRVEDGLARLATVTTPIGKTMAQALDESKNAAIEWSKVHTQTAEQFLDANYNMGSAGLNATQALEGTRTALLLATATMGDAGTASNLVATLYNNMADKTADAGREMTRLGDVLAKTQALFQIKDLGQLNESLKMGTPAALQFGVSVEQLSNALGFLNTAGLQGSMAGTAFSATMRQMGKASKALRFDVAKTADGGVDFAATIGNIEKKFGSFAKMTDDQKAKFQQVFGDEGLRGISLMLGKSDELATSLGQIGNATGVMAEQAKTIERTRSKGWQIMANRIEAVKIALGDALLPVLDRVMPHIESIVGGIDRWVTANKDLIGSGFGKFIDGAMSATKTFAEGFGAGFMEAWPAIKGALGELGSAFSTVFGGSSAGTVRDFAVTLGKVTAAAVGVAATVGGVVVGAAVLLGKAWTLQIGIITGAWDLLISGIGGVILWFDTLSARGRYALGSLVTGAKEAARGLIDGLVGGIRNGAVWVLEAITSLGTSAVNALKGLLGISSPSKVFAGLGEATGAGFAKGIEASMPASISAPVLEPPKLPAIDARRAHALDDVMTSPAWFGMSAARPKAEQDASPERGPATSPQMVTPQERTASSINETRTENVDRTELTIKDKTGGRAQVTKPGKGKVPIKLEPSGAFGR